MSDKFILDKDRKVVPAKDILEWGCFFEATALRTVAKDKIGDADVSTVFLGLDHGFGQGEPVLWETMVFGGPFDQTMERCSGTWQDAEAMHKRMVDQLQAA